ncbi:MAG: hypothetical protein ACJ782_05395 [Actinomycetota bacterium]
MANAATPATAIPRSNIFAFASVLDGEVESLAVAPDGLHVFAGARVSPQGQDQRPGRGHGRQRRPALHRRHLQDRQRRGPDRHRQCRQVRHHPDGSRLIAIGNWTSVAGLRRDQIVMLDLAACPVAVTGWSTTRYQQQCAAVFATYLRDVDVSPDGSYSWS